MGFILGGLETESYDRTYSDRELIRRIIGYFRPEWKRMLLVAGMVLLNSYPTECNIFMLEPYFRISSPQMIGHICIDGKQKM